MTPEERFFRRSTLGDEGCWIWTGAVTKSGYPKFAAAVGAHRWSYEHFIGPIAPSLTIDHLCGRPRCVNPDHLEPVTMRENLRRGNGWAGRNARKTACPKGHPYGVRDAAGARRCRECWRQRAQERRDRLRSMICPRGHAYKVNAAGMRFCSVCRAGNQRRRWASYRAARLNEKPAG